MERLLTTTVERDGAEPVLLCCNTYDDLGRLATQSLGSSTEGSHAIIRTVPLMVGDGSYYLIFQVEKLITMVVPVMFYRTQIFAV